MLENRITAAKTQKRYLNAKQKLLGLSTSGTYSVGYLHIADVILSPSTCIATDFVDTVPPQNILNTKLNF